MRPNKCILAREDNIVLVDFRPEPDEPMPPFPGASAKLAALRQWQPFTGQGAEKRVGRSA